MRTDNRSDLLRRRVIGKSVIFHENEVTYLNYIQDARENVFPKNPNSEQPDNSWKVVQGHRASIDVDCAQRRWFWWKGVETPFHWARDQEPLRGCDAWAPPKCSVNNLKSANCMTKRPRKKFMTSISLSTKRLQLKPSRPSLRTSPQPSGLLKASKNKCKRSQLLIRRETPLWPPQRVRTSRPSSINLQTRLRQNLQKLLRMKRQRTSQMLRENQKSKIRASKKRKILKTKCLRLKKRW